MSKEVSKEKSVKFFISLFIALLCVALLGMLNSCSEDDLETVDQVFCYQETEVNDFVTCQDYNQPVCGCNGETYKNACEARYQFGITNWTNGPCQIAVDCKEELSDTICYALYAPVCGCNGKTYPNDCYATSAGIDNYSTGICGTTKAIICKGQSLTIGSPDLIEGYSYNWSVDLGCENCNQIEISPENSLNTTLTVMQTLNGVETTVDVLAYEIIVQSCID